MAESDIQAGQKLLSVKEVNSKDFFKVLMAIDAFSKAKPLTPFRKYYQSASISRLSEAEGNKKLYGNLQLTPIKSLKMIKTLPLVPM